MIKSTGNVGIGTISPTAAFQVAQGTAGVGTVTITETTVCTGTGTQFLNTFKVGDSIIITKTAETKVISAIASDTVMTIAAATNTADSAYTFAGGTRFSVLANGNVGIGTTAPNSELHVKNAATTGYLSKEGTITVGDVNPNSTQGLFGRFQDNGDVGSGSSYYTYIGNNAKHVEGQDYLTYYKGNGWIPPSVMALGGDGAVKFLTSQVGEENNPDVTVTLAERMTILQGGNVGIGTTVPNVKFQVNSSLSGSDAQIGLVNTASGGIGWYLGSTDSGNDSGAGKLYFNTSYDSSSTAKVIFDSNGNVGIGTISPTAALQLKAGTATANTAPLKLTAGTLLGTPEAGAVEMDANHIYWSKDGSNRYQLDQQLTAGMALSALTAATGTNTIDSLTNAQTWNWSTASTQNPMTMNFNGLTTGTGLTLASSAAGLTTNGALQSITLSGNNVNNIGDLLYLNSSGANSIAKALDVAVASTGAPTNGLVRFNFSGAHTNTGFQFDDVTTAGTAMALNANALAAGTGLAIASSSTGNNMTGSLQSITLSGSNVGNTGDLLYLNSSGANSIAKALDVAVASTGAPTNGLVRFNFSGAHTGNGFQIDDVATAGTTMAINANSLTTGTGLSVSGNALTTGNLVNIASTSTAAASNTQTLLNLSLSGSNGTTGQTTYGAQISNTHAGTGTNVGLKTSVSGGTNNYGLWVDAPTAIFGAGEAGTPSTVTLRGAAASGTNITGADMYFDASNGTGSGSSGKFIFRTAPAGVYTPPVVTTVNLIPNAAGEITGLSNQNPSSTNHWDKVDDPVVSPDDGATGVAEEGNPATGYDLYNVPDQALTGTITNVTVWIRGSTDSGDGSLRTVIKTHSAEYRGTTHTPPYAYTNYSTSYDLNPNTSAAWTWAEINALHIGVEIYATGWHNNWCTQVYAVVSYGTAASQADPVLASRLTIDNAGNVGIGTAGPGALLDVQSAATTGTAANITANSLTSGTGLAIGSTAAGLTGNALSVTTGSTGVPTAGLVRLNFNGARTAAGTGFQIDDISTTLATTMAINANSLTTGLGLSILNTGTGITTAGSNTGSLLNVNASGATTAFTGSLANINFAGTAVANTGALLNINASGAAQITQPLLVTDASTGATTNGMVRFNFTGARTAAGTGFQIDDISTTLATTMAINANSLTSGIGEAQSYNALSTGKGLTISSSSTGLTTAGANVGSLFNVNTSGAITGFTGNLANISMAGASASGNTGSLLNINDAGALNLTKLLTMNSSSTTNTTSLMSLTSVSTGTIANGLVRFNFNGIRTAAGNAFQIDDISTTLATTMAINANSLTTGNALAISATAAGLTGNALSVTTGSTGAVTNGLVRFNFNAAHTGNGFQIDDLTATGIAMALNANSVTTGNALSISGNALTTGNLVNIASTSTAATSNTQTLLNLALSGVNGTAGQTTYASQIANTHSGVSSTNIGLLLSASGASTNYALIINGGDVGIGTTAPAKRLDVLEAVSEAQLRVSYSGSVYSELYTDSSGDLRISATGGDVRLLDENFWACSGGGCPSITPSGNGNIVAEGGVTVGTSSATCDASNRGTIRVDQVGSGSADILKVCLKKSDDSYQWVQVAIGN